MAIVYSPLRFLLQRQPDQPVCLICHEQRNIQHIIIQLQIVQGEAHAELYLPREQLLEFSQTPAGWYWLLP